MCLSSQSLSFFSNTLHHYYDQSLDIIHSSTINTLPHHCHFSAIFCIIIMSSHQTLFINQTSTLLNCIVRKSAVDHHNHHHLSLILCILKMLINQILFIYIIYKQYQMYVISIICVVFQNDHHTYGVDDDPMLLIIITIITFH